jgi:hypothetical protein
MNRNLYIIILILLTVNAKAQINELGLFAGGSNYIGDIGPTDYISPNEPAIGIIYKWKQESEAFLEGIIHICQYSVRRCRF